MKKEYAFKVLFPCEDTEGYDYKIYVTASSKKEALKQAKQDILEEIEIVEVK